MITLKEGGLTATFMSMLADVNLPAISKTLLAKGIRQPLGIVADEKITGKTKSRRNFRYTIKQTREVLDEYIRNKHPIASNKKVHAFYNFKGGTGKTTICYQVATHLALCGYKVLVVDADAQGHLTVSFGFFDFLKMETLSDVLINNRPYEEIIVNIFEGLDLIPGNLSLTNIDIRLREMPRQEDVLKRSMSNLKSEYDFIIFDCNPSMSSLNRNILNFSEVLDVVCETHPYSVNGMKLMMDDLKRFYKLMDTKNIPDVFIIPNKYEDRSGSSAEAVAVLNKFYGDYITPNFAVRRYEEFPKSARDQLPISFFCKSNSNAFKDICDLVRIIISKSEFKNKELFDVA